MSGESNRLDYIDVMKGICIILVVIGHLAEKISPVPSFFHYIYSFHMPAMIFCSGVVAEISWKKHGGRCWISKKVKSLVVPYIIWSFINPIILLGIIRFNFKDALKAMLISNQSYWYLACLFILSVIYYAIQKSFSTTGMIPVAMIFIVAIALITKNPYIEQAMGYFPFFYLGVLIIRFNIFYKLIENDWIVLISLVAFIILVRYFNKFDGSLYMLFIRLLCGAFAVPVLLKISKMDFFNTKIGSIIRTYGRNSLIIYLCHYFFITELGVVRSLKLSVIETALYLYIVAMIICCFCVLIGRCLETNTIMSRMLLGRR